MLLNLLDSKINFHNLKDWSSRERLGKADADSEQRLKQLRESRDKVETLILKSANEDKEEKCVTINSIIEINIE